MRIASLLRELWRRRRLTTVGLAFAALCALPVAFNVVGPLPPRLESRQYHAGVAAAAALVDSPRSQVTGSTVVDETLQGAAVDIPGLRARAHLLTSLIAAGPLGHRIAALAHVDPNRLIVRVPIADGPAVRATSKPRRLGRRMSVLGLSVSEELPIIKMAISAPDVRTAADIAHAVVRALQEHVDSVAVAGRVPPDQRLAVSALRPPVATTIVRGPRHLMILGVFVGVALVWCSTMLVVPRLRRLWRELGAADAPGPRSADVRPLAAPGDEPAVVAPALSAGSVARTRGRRLVG